MLVVLVVSLSVPTTLGQYRLGSLCMLNVYDERVFFYVDVVFEYKDEYDQD